MKSWRGALLFSPFMDPTMSFVMGKNSDQPYIDDLTRAVYNVKELTLALAIQGEKDLT